MSVCVLVYWCVCIFASATRYVCFLTLHPENPARCENKLLSTYIVDEMNAQCYGLKCLVLEQKNKKKTKKTVKNNVVTGEQIMYQNVRVYV